MQVLEEAVLSDLVYGVVNCPADQFGARCACLPPQLVDLLVLLSGELKLRFFHQARAPSDLETVGWIMDCIPGCAMLAKAMIR